MKKIVSIVVCLSLLVGLLQFNIYAEAGTLNNVSKSEDKISVALAEKISSMDTSEVVAVELWLKELPLEYFEQSAWQTVSSVFGVSAFDSIYDENIRSTLSHEQSTEIVQCYIETKREYIRQACTKYNQSVIRRLGLEDEVIGFSQYIPLVRLNMTNSDILAASKLPEIQIIDLYTDIELEVIDGVNILDETVGIANEPRQSISNRVFLNADDAASEFGLDGSNVKIGILDEGIPNVANISLVGLDITIADGFTDVISHATNVTGICANIAPSASYYCIGEPTETDIFAQIDWLTSQGVNIINASMRIGNGYGAYDSVSRFLDRTSQYCDVLFVVSAGNKDVNNNPNNYLNSSAMAYNAITVANYAHGNTYDYSNDVIYSPLAVYNDAIVSGCAYKPDICAPGVGVTAAGINMTGTSQATPYVSGIAALLLEQDPFLKLSPVSTKSILMAGVNKETPHYYTPDSYSMDVEDEEGQPTETYRLYGAGLVDAYNACKIAYSDVSDYRNGSMQTEDTYREYSVFFAPSDGEVRVAVVFERTDKVVEIENDDGEIVSGFLDSALHDLDLQIYSPSGVLIHSSTTTNNNVEIVDFTPSVEGVYRIRICQVTSRIVPTEYAIAWSKTNT